MPQGGLLVRARSLILATTTYTALPISAPP